MLLLVKAIVSYISPLPLSLGLLICGLVLLWLTRRQRAGKVVTSIGVGLLLLFSLGAASDTLLRPLEQQYPPLAITVSEAATIPTSFSTTRWIVVLGGGAFSNPQLPLTSNLYDPSLARVVEGVELHKRIPGSKLIFSGGKFKSSEPEAVLMAQVAKLLGVAQQDMLLEPESKDTEAQAMNIKPLVGNDRLILVTSAGHMPRSMALFKQAGMSPIPAPTDYQTNPQGIKLEDFNPKPDALRKAGLAIHEYIGLAWAKLRGKA